MTLDVQFTVEASRELQDAVSWYDERQGGLGTSFLSSVDNAVNSVADWPRLGTPIDDLKGGIEVRRLDIGRFPYLLIYMVDTKLVVVLAVAHQRRRPRYWVDRVAPEA